MILADFGHYSLHQITTVGRFQIRCKESCRLTTIREGQKLLNQLFSFFNLHFFGFSEEIVLHNNALFSYLRVGQYIVKSRSNNRRSRFVTKKIWSYYASLSIDNMAARTTVQSVTFFFNLPQ